MNINLKHLFPALASLLLPAWLTGQCIGNVSWNGGTPAAGTLNANATILGTVGVQMRSAGSFAGARPTYTSIIEPYSGFTYQTLWIARGASFAAGTYTSYKLSMPLPPSLIHISIRDIRGDFPNQEHQRVEGYLNGIPVAANFEDAINGAFITGGNIINGANTTTSLIQSAMRAFFVGPVDSIVVKATSLSDYVIVNLHVRCDILLPFQLLQFSAEALTQGNLLTWKVQAEENVLGYTVQRSADGINWKIIGQQGVGSGQGSVNRYTFLDDDPVLPTSLYRIYSIEQDGQGSFSKTISVTQPSFHKRGEVIYFPNPVKDKLRIILPKSGRSFSTVEMFTVLGQRVLHQTIQGSSEINLAHVQRGNYILILQSQDGYSETHRIVLQ
jgi:hypothetical protein